MAENVTLLVGDLLNADLVKVARALIDSVANDVSFHGGLTTRETIRASDELRLVISRIEAAKP